MVKKSSAAVAAEGEPEQFSLWHEGLGEGAAFYRSHPLLNFTYFAIIIGITMFSIHPAFLALSFVMAWVYSVMLRGKKAVKFNLLIMIPTIILMTLFNTLNVHNGVTVLFYLNYNRVTLEAITYGFAAAILLSTVIIWFSCFNAIITADKFIYLFGRFAPVIALTISMVMRFIPLLQSRFREVSAAQRCMGRGLKGSSFIEKIRIFAKEISILIAWSLEASIESADSMEARGYGLRGRTSFHLFRLARSEKMLLLVMLALGAIPLLACANGLTSIYYYPKIILPTLSFVQTVALIAYGALMLIPPVLDFRGWQEWK